MALFQVSATRASEWIRELRDRHPSWLTWNSKTRSFEATRQLYSTESESSRSYSLLQYLSLTRGLHGSTERLPMVRAFHDFIAPDPRTFSTLQRAISRSRQVSIVYRSLKEPEPHAHLIEPHALVLAGPRWHVRAYSHERREFRDFALGRIVENRMEDAPAAHPWAQDVAWTTRVDVKLVAHPDLSVGQEDVVRHEYFGGAAERIETSRGALVPYLLHELRVALDTGAQRPPDFLLAVRNVKDVRPWVFSA
jgi:predicted DNA-binding transcriptional regulator YafY